MFSLKSKLDHNLRINLDKSLQQNYRVLIKCKRFEDNIEKKILSLKGTLICSIKSQGLIAANLSQRSIYRLIEYPEVNYICFDEYALLCAMSISTATGGRSFEKFNFTGKGISIGLIDTGVFPHPDLSSPHSKILKFTDLINDIKYPYDDHGHGSFIAGILCGSGISSKNLYKGIAEKSSLICYKAFNSTGKGYVSNILCALESLIEESEHLNVKVICLPFELISHNMFIISLFHKLFKLANEKNIIVVIPSGSSPNGEGSMNPLCFSSDCLVVGGINNSKSSPVPYIYSASSCYSKTHKPDLSVACVNITSINTDKNYISQKNGIKIYSPRLETPYITYTGTSISAAFISAICSLIFEANPSLTFKDISSLLKLYSNNMDIDKNFIGDGILDTKRLFTMLANKK
ncbi:Subtilase family protein [Clostridium cavendishii DSM 21758]|uniref:Subtilase family protein n=1 Tax=Clostridium cavendishii DSM 21758 TaxID=1121302 RepID=A0A1M6PT85_9CLOT|nr:S8 family serine peptidase [Clostridium cavendishii]SHK11125.1 Subtilase family protein [Clostridium cavendishii DSM 21758]